MNNINLINSFQESDYKWKMSSGYGGYQNTKTSEWIYEWIYIDRLHLKLEFDQKMKFLSQFRSECLPFGEYPDFVLLEFLNKYFDKQVKEVYNVV